MAYDLLERDYMKTLIVILSVLISTSLISTTGFAQTYKWVDDKGVVHFTDDITKIPGKYRPQVDKIGTPEEKIETIVDVLNKVT